MKDRFKTKVYPWILWTFSALFLFYKYAIEVSPSVMTSALMADFRINGADLGNLAAFYFYSYLVMQIPAGILVDRYGPRFVTSIAIVLCAIGSICFSYTHSYGFACFGRLLNGIGASFSAITCLKLTANWFSAKKFAFMAGLMMTVGMLGAVFGQAPLYGLISTFGWRAAMASLGYFGIAFGLCFYFLVRDKPSWAFDVHIIPDVKTLFTTIKDVLKRSQPWTLSVYSGLAFAPITVFGGLWGLSFLKDYVNVSHTTAAHMVSFVFLGFAIGAPTMGCLSDYVRSRKYILQAGTLLSFLFLSVILFAGLKHVVLYSLMLFLFGFFNSAFLLSFTMIREITAPILAATAIGFMNTFDALIGALSEPLTGKLLDIFWDGKLINGARSFDVFAYQVSLSTLPLFLLISWAITFWIKETYNHDDNYPSCLP